ncbi:MAG: transglutaminase, partial [Bacteroidota bacterium]|nr:transglutaminase [Bacteroidota bacterium]
PTWIPFVREEWSSREQQQNYLPGIPGGDDLKITPVSSPKNHPLTINGTSTILENGTLKGKLILDADGQSDASIRGIFTRNRKDQWEKSLKNELVKIAQDIQFEEISYNNPYGYMKEAIHIEITYSIPNFATITDKEIIFTPFIAQNLFKRAQAHLYTNTKIDKKKYAFRDGCSRLVNLSETINLPAIKDAIYLPKSDKLDGTAAAFNGEYNINGNQLKLNETITIKKRIFEADEWDNYKAVIKAQQKFADKKVILSR